MTAHSEGEATLFQFDWNAVSEVRLDVFGRWEQLQG